MIGLDTTVLLTHEIQEATGHEALRAHISMVALSGDVQFALTPQVLQEFVHVATDPRRFKAPLTMDQALERSRFWWESAEVVQCHPGGRAWEQAWAWMEKFRLGRKRILDTYLAATYNERGINRLATANTIDFAVFGVFEFESWAQSPTPRDKTQPS
jgi:predicted nucleic acid-binding protein